MLKKTKRVNFLLSVMVLCLFIYPVYAGPLIGKDIVLDSPDGSSFGLVTADKTTAILYDSGDFSGVVRAVSDLQADIERVTGKKPELVTESGSNKELVIVGTIGKSKVIDSLISSGKLTADDLKGKWESFVITTISQPVAGVDKALVIAGSDRRGTIYGIYELSEQMGVSPWYWWADVPVKAKKELYVMPGRYASGEPQVKYRGIFINDEDWGLKPWSSNNYEKELGDIGPKTYARVFELMLRLHGNMVAPAMHSCTGAFYFHPESKVVADEYGVMITTSHCEPLLFNNAAKTEWDTSLDGEWVYASNKDRILKKLDDRVKEASVYENIYTVGMRGLHDEGMRGNLTDAQKVSTLAQVMADERNILTKYIKRSADEIPQIFVPYKETLDIYELGLQVPDDVTLVWADDNYGYIKRLNNPEESKRSGGAGVYYHTSYLGPPHDYLWVCTTPPVLMYSELKKAYDNGANRYWLINVGDIKPAEIFLQMFFDFAWKTDNYDIASINRSQSEFLAGVFGQELKASFQDILDNYYRLAWSRKPEFMGWEREWDSREYTELANTQYSFQNYNDAQQRLADYKRISELADQIEKSLPESYRPAFFELVGYPVKGSYQMNRKFMMAQLNSELLKSNDQAGANWAAQQSKDAFAEIERLSKEYNAMLNGKWNGMMMVPPGFVAKYQNMPKVVETQGVEAKAVDLTPDSSKNKLDGCTVIDLKGYKNKVASDGHTLDVIGGIGYDWQAIRLGLAKEAEADAKNLNGSRFEYEFTGVKADSVKVYVYVLPTFPIYKGRGTKLGVSVDGQPAHVADIQAKEFSKEWKDRVLQNASVIVAEFPVKQSDEKHTLSLLVGDPGLIVQRVVIDWGGLKQTYVGPALKVSQKN